MVSVILPVTPLVTVPALANELIVSLFPFMSRKAPLDTVTFEPLGITPAAPSRRVPTSINVAPT